MYKWDKGRIEPLNIITGEVYKHNIYYAGMVDDLGKISLYEGKVRVIDPDEKEYVTFIADKYLDHISEHIES